MILKTLLIAGILGFTVVYCQLYDGDFDYALFDFERDGTNCTQAGFMCENCTHIAFCFASPNGSFDKEIIRSCDAGETCLNGFCTTEENTECNLAVTEYKFVCHQPGVYPDPFDCKKYHLCKYENNAIVPDSTEIACQPGFGYDPIRGICRVRLANNVCPKSSVEPCKGPGQGPLPENPSLFYVCLLSNINGTQYYFPQFFHCDNDFEYFNGACRDPKPNGILNGNCISVGNFYDSSDCRKYRECPSVGVAPMNRTCSINNHFNSKTQRCEVFPCNVIY